MGTHKGGLVVGGRYHQSYLFKYNLRFVALILWLSPGGIDRKGKTNLADKCSDSYLYGRPTELNTLVI